MNTKLSISFERRGILNKDMTQLVSSHNEGFSKLTILEVMAFIKAQKPFSPSTLENMKLDFDEKENTIHFYENGKDLTLSITENQYYTLEMIEEGQEVGADALHEALDCMPTAATEDDR